MKRVGQALGSSFVVWATVALGLAIVVVIAPGLSAPFQFDDWADIVLNPAAQARTFFAELPTTVRPLLKATYAVVDAVLGPSALGHHVVNLLLHLGAAACVFALARRAAEAAGRAVDAVGIGFATAALWALHPVATENVIYASGRSAVLSSLLVFAALLVATSKRLGAASAATGAMLAFLAPLARETAVVLPLLLLWWQATLEGNGPIPARIRRAAPIWIGTALAVAVLLVMPRHRDLVAFSLESRAPLEALRVNVRAVFDVLAFWPAPWRVSIDPPSPVVGGWLDLGTILCAAALVVALCLAFAFRRRWPIASLGVGWALIALAPSNSLVWRIEPVGLRPLYLASFGLALPLAFWLADARLRRVGLGVIMVLALALASLTMTRAILYRSTVALWEDAVAKAPAKGRAWVMLGSSYLAEGWYTEAEEAFVEAVRLAPWLVEAERGLDAVQELRRAEDRAR